VTGDGIVVSLGSSALVANRTVAGAPLTVVETDLLPVDEEAEREEECLAETGLLLLGIESEDVKALLTQISEIHRETG
jgi:hypothetical protein